MKIIFGKAEHGWLPTKVVADEQEFEFFASDVPNDFLAEMVHALEVFLEGRVGIALLHEEPRTQRFVFDKKETRSILRIEEFSDFIVAYNVANTIPNPSKYQLRLEWEDEPEKIAKVFWRGLKNLESRISTDLTLEHWDWGFPSNQLRRLEAKLKLK